MIDRYTKVVLTLIALALVAWSVRLWVEPPTEARADARRMLASAEEFLAPPGRLPAVVAKPRRTGLSLRSGSRA
jgi:hypothetical protein